MSEIDSMIETIEQLTRENEQLKLRLSSVSPRLFYVVAPCQYEDGNLVSKEG